MEKIATLSIVSSENTHHNNICSKKLPPDMLKTFLRAGIPPSLRMDRLDQAKRILCSAILKRANNLVSSLELCTFVTNF